MYFVSDRPGGLGAGDIYRSRLVNGRYAAPENIGPPVNTSEAESNVFIAQDESFLIDAGAFPGGRGGTDLYISTRNASGEWTPRRPQPGPLDYEGVTRQVRSAGNGNADIYSVDFDWARK